MNRYKDRKTITYELEHGIEVTVLNWKRGPLARDLVEFLAEVLGYLKQWRTSLKQNHSGPELFNLSELPFWGSRFGQIEISFPSSTDVTPSVLDVWIREVAFAFSVAQSLEQIAADLPTYREAAQREGGVILQVVDEITKPEGELDAMRILLKNCDRGRIRDATGYEGISNDGDREPV